MQENISRYAPSPTGSQTIGSIRTGLFAYAFIKASGGKFILRIEDSDAKRSTHENLIDVIESLEWLGISWDYGPKLSDVKNNIYDKEHFQSKRNDIYWEFINKLLGENKAYKDNGTIVFRMPKEDVVLTDLVLGEIKFPKSDQKDFIIAREDGTILFHAANVIDDIITGATHLIKGNDHVSNAPKHIALFKAFGAKVPQYVHLPLIFDDRGQKLSKRRTDQNVLIKDFRKDGYLSKSIINILGNMGWSPKDKPEYFDIDYICKNFRFEDCLKANPRYDAKKLLSVNTNHILDLTSDEFAFEMDRYTKEFYPEYNKNVDGNWTLVRFVMSGRGKTLKDIVEQSLFLFDYKQKTNENQPDKNIMKASLNRLVNINWTKEEIMIGVNQIVKDTESTMAKVSMAIRLAVTGGSVSPPIDSVVYCLGKDKFLNRINECLK